MQIAELRRSHPSAYEVVGSSTSSNIQAFRSSITLTDIDCACVVGICEWEQVDAQPLRLDVTMQMPERKHVSTLDETIDYTVLVKAIQFFCRHGHWLLIEDIAEGLIRWLLQPPHPSERRVRIERAAVTIRKPRAARGAAMPDLTITGTAPAIDENPCGNMVVLVESSCVSARRIVLPQEQRYTKSPRHCFFVLSGSLECVENAETGVGVSIGRGSIEGRTVQQQEYRAVADAVLLEIQR